MARQRMIKPKFWDDIKVAKLKRDARLIYIGMWNFSDDSGVVIADPVWLKSKIFPYDKDVKLPLFRSWLSDLEKLGFIRIVSFKKESFYYLPKFSRHQTINRPNEDEKNIPDADLKKVLLETSKSTSDSTDSHKQADPPQRVEKEPPEPPDSMINHGTIIDESVPLREDKYKISISEDKEKIRGTPPDIVYPFSEIDFLKMWKNWKNYRAEEFKKSYKSKQSEQAALSHLAQLSKGDVETAKKIIIQSLGNQWQGLFELKQNFNGKSSSKHGKHGTGKVTGEQLDEAFTDFYTPKKSG